MIKIVEQEKNTRVRVSSTKVGDTFSYGGVLYLRTTDDINKPDRLTVITLPAGVTTFFTLHNELVELVDLAVTVIPRK